MAGIFKAVALPRGCGILFSARGGSQCDNGGSGGPFRHTPTFPSCLITRYFPRQGANNHHIKAPFLRLSANLKNQAADIW